MGRGQARRAGLVQTGQGGCKDGKELGLHRAFGKIVNVSKDVPSHLDLDGKFSMVHQHLPPRYAPPSPPLLREVSLPATAGQESLSVISP